MVPYQVKDIKRIKSVQTSKAVHKASRWNVPFKLYADLLKALGLYS